MRSVLDSLESALCIVSADGTVVATNRRWRERFAQVPAVAGTDLREWAHRVPGMERVLAAAADLAHRVLGSTGPGHLSVKERGTVRGEERWFVARVGPVADHHVARAVVTLVDITAGMRVQERLAAATAEAEHLALVARATDNAVVISDPDGVVEWANEPFLDRAGLDLAGAVGLSRPAMFTGPALGTAEFVRFVRCVARGEPADAELLLTDRRGRPVWSQIQVRAVHDEGRVQHLVWVEQDVTARRGTQDRLRAAMRHAESLAEELNREKTLLSAVISTVPQMVYWKDAAGRFVGCNGAYLALRGVTSERDLVGLREDAAAPDVAGPGAAHPLVRALTDLEDRVSGTGVPVVDRAVDVVDGHGRERSMLLSVLPLGGPGNGTGPSGGGVIGVAADISRVRDLERQLAESTRLESIGQLAAGIAHEINTPLQFATDNTRFLGETSAQMLQALRDIAEALEDAGREASGGDGCGPAERLRQRVAAVLAGLDVPDLAAEVPDAVEGTREGLARVTQIVRAMKDYSHPGTGRTDTDVNRAVETTVQVCRNEWKYVARVDLDLDPHVGLVPCFAGDLQQALLNLVVNAAQALAGQEGREGQGVIRVWSRRDGDEVEIGVADDGPGIPPEVLPRIFDPFFTTKPVGGGTGQGLSLVHAVVAGKHRGRISVDSRPGAGAAFVIRLPYRPPS